MALNWVLKRQYSRFLCPSFLIQRCLLYGSFIYGVLKSGAESTARYICHEVQLVQLQISFGLAGN